MTARERHDEAVEQLLALTHELASQPPTLRRLLVFDFRLRRVGRRLDATRAELSRAGATPA